MATKPPLGLRPRILVLEERYTEITDAIGRYIADGRFFPLEWAIELGNIASELKAADQKMKAVRR